VTLWYRGKTQEEKHSVIAYNREQCKEDEEIQIEQILYEELLENLEVIEAKDEELKRSSSLSVELKTGKLEDDEVINKSNPKLSQVS